MPIDVTSLLKEWGVTVGLLSVAATCLLLLFALSMREFFYWFLKLSKIVKNQELILQRIGHLEKLIENKNENQDNNADNSPTKPKTPSGSMVESGGSSQQSEKPSAQFPIHAKRETPSPQTFQLLS